MTAERRPSCLAQAAVRLRDGSSRLISTSQSGADGGLWHRDPPSWRGHQLLPVRVGYAELAARSSPVGWSTDPSPTQLKSHRTMSELWFQDGINCLRQSSLIGILSKRASLPTVVSQGQTWEVGALRREGVYGGALQSAASELGGLLSRIPWPLLKTGHLSSDPGG